MKVFVNYWKVYKDGSVSMFTKKFSSYSAAESFRNNLPENGYNHMSKIEIGSYGI